MSAEGTPPEEEPSGRRDSWSLRAIVRDVSGHSLEEYQDPGRAPHPYLAVKPPPEGGSPRPRRPLPPSAAASEPPADPVGRFFPPLTGRIGRQAHDAELHHHAETLRRLASEPGAGPAHPASPARRPERIYLHYLLLHLDRLSEHDLRYLQHAVQEELDERAAPSEPPSPAGETPR